MLTPFEDTLRVFWKRYFLRGKIQIFVSLNFLNFHFNMIIHFIINIKLYYKTFLLTEHEISKKWAEMTIFFFWNRAAITCITWLLTHDNILRHITYITYGIVARNFIFSLKYNLNWPFITHINLKCLNKVKNSSRRAKGQKRREGVQKP